MHAEISFQSHFGHISPELNYNAAMTRRVLRHDGTSNTCVWDTRKLCVFSLSLPAETGSHTSNIYRYTNCDMRASSHQFVQYNVVRSSVVMFTYVSSSVTSHRCEFLIIKLLY